MSRTFFKVGLPFLILGMAAVALATMVTSKRPPERVQRSEVGALVRVMEVKFQQRRVVVRSHGTIQAQTQAAVVPQVSGRTEYVDPQFVAGGFFRKGEVFLRIERIDYELAVDQRKAEVTRAEYELAQVESNARFARRQWEKVQKRGLLPGENPDEIFTSPDSLVFYEPQLKNAQAQLEAARAALKRAELDLSRTTITALFNCLVRSENVDVGQYLRAGEPVATVFGTDILEVVVPLSLDEIALLSVPGQDWQREGSLSEVHLMVGQETFTWKGKVVRMLGEVDSKGRMARVVVQIPDPFKENGNSSTRPMLTIGMFVGVSLYGRESQNVVVIPRNALRQGATVWVVSAENRLHIRSVQEVWGDAKEIYVAQGLQDGERVVLSSLSGAVEGMKLRPVEEKVESFSLQDSNHAEVDEESS